MKAHFAVLGRSAEARLTSRFGIVTDDSTLLTAILAKSEECDQLRSARRRAASHPKVLLRDRIPWNKLRIPDAGLSALSVMQNSDRHIYSCNRRYISERKEI
jgi:hypothetical protein